MTFARFVGGVVQEVLTSSPSQLFSPGIAALFVSVPEGTKVGAVREKDGSITPPPPPPPPSEAPPPPPPPSPLPVAVSNFQARYILRTTLDAQGVSLETKVDTAFRTAKAAAASLPESDPARLQADLALLAWEQSSEFVRTSPLIASLAGSLGLTDARIDDLFRAASLVSA